MDIQAIQHDIKPSHSALNGIRGPQNGSPLHGHDSSYPAHTNGDHYGKHDDEDERPLPSLEDLERELPVIEEGQVFLGLAMHQLVQDLYAQLLNVAET